MSNWLTIEEIDRKIQDIQVCKRYCKHCGHSLIIIARRDYVECSYCHNFVFRDEKSEFMYRMKQNLIKEKRNNK